MIRCCRNSPTHTTCELIRLPRRSTRHCHYRSGESYRCVFASSLRLQIIIPPLRETSFDMTNQPMRHRPSGFGNPWLQLALSVLCVLASEFLLKRGAADVAEPNSAWSWTGFNGLASPLVWWAILLIIASSVSWLYVLRYIPLTIAFPPSRVVDILVPLGCWIFLGEFISTLRWCGIALVVIGLALVAKPIAQIEERL